MAYDRNRARGVTREPKRATAPPASQQDSPKNEVLEQRVTAVEQDVAEIKEVLPNGP
jgi:hypothetical protein